MIVDHYLLDFEACLGLLQVCIGFYFACVWLRVCLVWVCFTGGWLFDCGFHDVIFVFGAPLDLTGYASSLWLWCVVSACDLSLL